MELKKKNGRTKIGGSVPLPLCGMNIPAEYGNGNREHEGSGGYGCRGRCNKEQAGHDAKAPHERGIDQPASLCPARRNIPAETGKKKSEK